MQRILYSILTTLLFLIVSTACKEGSDTCDQMPEVSQIKVNIATENLTSEIASIKNIADGLDFKKQHPFVTNYFFNTTEQLDDSAMASMMSDIFSHPSYSDTLYQQVKNTFGDFSAISADFKTAFTLYRYYYPEVSVPEIQYVLSGLLTDLYVSDTLISIAADYFLGSEARFVPLGIPQYILARYQKEYIVPMTMLLVTQEQNKMDPANQTLLSDMIYYGKSYYLAASILPCTADSLLIGYTAKEMEDINKNEHIIWANFLENDLLYESSHFIKNKFIGERPKTFEISNNCPGRIGVWTGWQIVKSYMDNNQDVGLKQLMNTTDANLIFAKANYKPKP